MIDILDAMRKNNEEANAILKKYGNSMQFATWDEDGYVYENADDCPYVRVANEDEDIHARLVTSVRWDEATQRIYMQLTRSEYRRATDDDWHPITIADDISYWCVLDHIINYTEYYID